MTAVASDKTTMPAHVLRAADLDEEQLADVLRHAAQMKRDPYGWAGALPGRTLITLVRTPSARAQCRSPPRRTGSLHPQPRSTSARSAATRPLPLLRSLLSRPTTSSS